ncbi:MAG: hypothetical protein V7646_427 [Pseudonocardia sp.]|jgi:glycosyltransferase involved in cell wall biosynthesis
MNGARRTVVQITPYYPPHLGGLENVVWHLAQQLSSRHDVEVVTTNIGASGEPRRTRDGQVTVRRHRALELAHTPVAPAVLSTLLRTPRSAVLHLHAAHAVLPEQVLLATALRKRPFFLHFHLDVDASGRFGRLLPMYKRHGFGRALRAAVGVMVLTDAQAEFVQATYGVDPDRTFVVPNGVGEAYFMPVRERTAGPLRLLFVGRLSVQKNVTRLLEAMSRVRSDVTLDIVGEGEQRPALLAAAERLGLSNVTFLGDRRGDDLVRRYAEADAFVLPSDKEGMSLAALEAMAAGLPVLATDVPGNSELLRGTGLLVEPDASALASAVEAVANDETLRLRLAENSSVSSHRYSWAAVAQRVEDVYAEVLG